MAIKILLRRGLEANLPDLDEGEPGWTTDTQKLYIGTSGATNVEVGGGASALDDLTDVNAPTPSAGQALVWDNGTSMWVPVDVYSESEVDALLAGYSPTGHTHDDRYYTEAEVDTLLAGYSPTGHSHNDLYYTEAEVDALLAGYSPTSHTHSIDDLTDVDTSTVAPTEGQILYWDNTAGQWEPGNPPSGTVASGTSVGNVLYWNGSAWAETDDIVVNTASDLTLSPTGNVVSQRPLRIEIASLASFLVSDTGVTPTGALATLKTVNQEWRLLNHYLTDTNAFALRDHTNGRNVIVASPGSNLTLSPAGITRVVKTDGAESWSPLSSTVAVFENVHATIHAGITILAGNATRSIINLGDVDDENIGSIQYNHADNSMGLFTNNSERVSIDSAGNVGIGTTSPGGILEARNPGGSSYFRVHLDNTNFNLTLNRDAINRNNNLIFATAGTANWYIGLADSDSLGSGTELFIGTSGGGANPAVVIETNGDVGIGVTSPSARLDVADAGAQRLMFSLPTTAFSGVSGSSVSTAALLRIQALNTTDAAGIWCRHGSSDWFAGVDGNDEFVITREASNPFITFDSVGDVSMTGDLELGTNDSNYHTINGTVEFTLPSALRFSGAMGTSTKNPATDAVDDWLEVQIGGVTLFIPAYDIS